MTLSYQDLTKKPDVLKCTVGPVENIYVIGCGGTGSYLVPDLVRAIKFANQVDPEKDHCLTLIDGDTVEERNIERQNFAARDVGKNKAEVLAKRYGQLFGITIDFIPEHITDALSLNRIMDANSGYNSYSGPKLQLIISCADNHYLRKVVHESFCANHAGIIWLDSGNETTFGQVVCGFNTAHRRSGYSMYDSNRKLLVEEWINHPGRHSYVPLPSVCEIFPEILEAEPPKKERRNCAIEVVENPQNILINRMAAVTLMSYVYHILYAQDITNEDGQVVPNNVITSYMTLFNTDGTMIPQPTTRAVINELLSKAYKLVDKKKPV